jgi:hypothetical protein
MALSIDELSSLYGLYGVNGVTQTSTQNTKTSGTEQQATDGDSYISTIAGMDLDAAIPSENYNDLARKILSTSAEDKTQDSTEYASVTDSASQTAETGGTQAAGGGSGGGDSSDSDDDDTVTEVVTINGVTYLQITTTDEDGNTTVTRTQIGAAPSDNDGKAVGTTTSAAAQALSL